MICLDLTLSEFFTALKNLSPEEQEKFFLEHIKEKKTLGEAIVTDKKDKVYICPVCGSVLISEREIGNMKCPVCKKGFYVEAKYKRGGE